MSTSIALNNQNIAFPVLHMNGNDPETLAHQYFNASLALEKFVEKFCEIEFHARDYYVAEPATWEKAVRQREEIKFKIQDIRQYLELHAAHCFEAS